jgi:GH43 family beta-xylosidase
MRSLLALAGAVAVLAAAAGTAAAGPAATFRNPVVPETAGDDSPDPWIFRHDGRYWLTYTSTDHVELRSATTLAGLADATPRRLWPKAGAREPDSRCCQLWAPEIHRLDGPNGPRWYLYYAANAPGGGPTHQMHVLESAGDDPAGPYRYKARLRLPDPYAIDGTVARVGGRTYLVYSGGNSFTPTALMLVELSNPWTATGPAIAISRPELAWERFAFPINEGPEVLRRGGTLNVVYSASWCGTGAYALGLLSVPAGANLLDPATWTAAKRPDPVFASRGGNGVWGPGHGSFFTSPDGRESWQVYHATEDDRGCFTGGLRTTRAQRFTWNPDGTPDFGAPVGLDADVVAPSGERGTAVQAERAVVGRRGRTVADRRLAGYRGLAVPRGTTTLRLRAPHAGRWRVRLRLLGGPIAGEVAFAGAGTGARGGAKAQAGAGTGARRAVTRTARRPRAGAVALDFGVVALGAKPTTLRLRLARPATLDQLVLEEAR